MSKRRQTSSEAGASNNSTAPGASGNLNTGAMCDPLNMTDEEKRQMLARLEGELGITSMATGARSRRCEPPARPLAPLRR